MKSSASVSRLDAIRDRIADSDLDGALISDPDNRFYCTGHLVDDHGPTEVAAVALIGANAALLLTGPNNVEWARSEAVGVDVEAWKRPWEPFVAEKVRELGWTRVGFEAESLSQASWDRIRQAKSGIEWIPLGDLINQMRWVKDDGEIALIQKAIDITDQAFEAVEETIRAGMTERQAAEAVQRLYLELGSDDAAFPTTVGSGPNSSRPHHRSGERVIQDGEPVVIDMGARVGGYCADLTRTTWTGDLSPQAREIYRAVQEAQEASLAAVRAGVPAKDVDQASRNVFELSGYKDFVIHGVGHGLGIRVHDGPSVNQASEVPLVAGHVVTIEPGLYIPGEFGVRIEDVVVVEEHGCRVLSQARKRRL